MQKHNKILLLLYVVILAVILSYGHYTKQRDNRDVPKTAVIKTIDTREIQRQREIKNVEAFLSYYNSPLTPYAKDFVDAQYIYGLDYRLLPIVSCVESSCGKNYKNNPFGWASDAFSYGSVREDIFNIAQRISVLPYYKTYRETRNIKDFSLAYNNPFANDYEKKLNYFMERIQ